MVARMEAPPMTHHPILADLIALLGAAHVLTGADRAPYLPDWTGHYTTDPLAVLRPARWKKRRSFATVGSCRSSLVKPV